MSNFAEYHKIQSLYKRDQKGRFIEGEWARPWVGALANLEWEWTEKVDGTNIRLQIDGVGSGVRIGGRTDRAQIPVHLLDALKGLNLESMAANLAAPGLNPFPLTLYGEGYGAKIQKGGGNYRDDQGFVLFDVRVGDYWLQRADVEDVARKLCLDVVPIVGSGTLHEAIEYVADMRSRWGDFAAEGVVCRPPVRLYCDNDRCIVKVKGRDVLRMREAA